MLDKGSEYLKTLHDLLARIEEEQSEQITSAAELIADALEERHALFAFGMVRSALPVSDLFIRAGGFALLNLIKAPALNAVAYDPPMLWIDMERLEGYGKIILKNAHTQPGDVIILVSVSGRNPVPVDMAMYAKEHEMKVIALTSMDYTQSVPSRHASGKKLYEFGDVVIDCHAVPGDATLEHEKIPVKYCPTSGPVNTAILQCLMAETLTRLAERDFDPPYLSPGTWMVTRNTSGDSGRSWSNIRTGSFTPCLRIPIN